MKKSLASIVTGSTTALTLAASLVAPVASNIVNAEDGEIIFDSKLTNEGETIDGGTLKYAIVSPDPLAGVFNNMYYTMSSDSEIINLFNPGIIGYNENFEIDDSGFADVAFDQDNKTVTITIPEGEKWDDGEDITIDDVIFPYYVIGHPDYTGIRYGDDFMNVEGMEEYHNGDTDEISGLERVDDYTLTVHYKEFGTSMLQAGGGVSTYMEPEHAFEGIEVKDMEDSEVVRQKPVGFGAFKVESVTPGEAVKFVRNDDYYDGAAKVDSVIAEVVNPSTIVSEMNAGHYDIASLPADQYETFKDAKNYKILGVLANVYTYISFKFGTWDDETGEVKPDESRVINNKALRQAMAYSIDNAAVAKEFYQGIRIAANSHITPNFKDYNNPDQKPISYDPEKAQKILEEAGFKDTNGDGFVEDPDGNEFTLKFAAMSGGETAEPLAQYYLQSWQQVGINVELTDGKLMEPNTFYERLKADDENIDVYQGAQGVGGDPNPTGLWARNAPFNYARYASDKNDELLAAISSDEAFDEEYRKQAYYDWQAFMIDELPNIPTLFRQEIYAVNNRVSSYDVTIGNDLKWSEVGLLADQPEAQ